MAPTPCSRCQTGRAVVKRPKNLEKLCKPCFLDVFEQEVHHTITSARLFRPGDRVAIGASGGKDSTVLASVLKTLNHRHGYGLELVLLSIDEGIKGYRDDSLETVKRNSAQYGMQLHVVGYDQLYGWTMDQVVETIGRKGNCTYCGVFRRQALDRGVRMLGISHLVTGHNADDMAETILMNLLRGDLPRLARGTSIVTGGGAGGAGAGDVRRSKPLKYAYEKEIVLYAHHKKLDYFSTECVYSPEAFRGTARALIKSLERVRPSVILDIVRSGEDLARLVGGASGEVRSCGGDGESGGGCASVDAKSQADEMGRLEVALKGAGSGLETEITLGQVATVAAVGLGGESIDGDERVGEEMDVEGRGGETMGGEQTDGVAREASRSGRASERERRRAGMGAGKKTGGHSGPMQTLGSCQTCGYMSSQAVCQACRLLETLNSNRAQVQL